MRTTRIDNHRLTRIVCLYLVVLLAAGCAAPAAVVPTATAPPPTQTLAPTLTPTERPRLDGLSADEAATLNSLVRVDDYPLYTMHYQGGYDLPASTGSSAIPEGEAASWACSLFAVLGDEENRLYGRNFDWQYSPAVLLYTDPPDGYASVSMVDIAYLGFDGPQAAEILDLPLGQRRSLLEAPHLPFDGMNERGLAIGMAAVPDGDMQPDPAKATVDSLMVIRLILDHAATVDEAVDILGSYNVNMGGGPPLHYLIADSAGGSALVEFYQGEMVVIPGEEDWHAATNFLRSAVGEAEAGQYSRYDRITERLDRTGGQLEPTGALSLLASVSQANTQWSVVYGISSMNVYVVMDRQYESVYVLDFGFGGN